MVQPSSQNSIRETSTVIQLSFDEKKKVLRLANALGVYLKIFILFLFLDSGEGREKKRERNTNVWPLTRPFLGTWPATQECALTGN